MWHCSAIFITFHGANTNANPNLIEHDELMNKFDIVVIPVFALKILILTLPIPYA